MLRWWHFVLKLEVQGLPAGPRGRFIGPALGHVSRPAIDLMHPLGSAEQHVGGGQGAWRKPVLVEQGEQLLALCALPAQVFRLVFDNEVRVAPCQELPSSTKGADLTPLQIQLDQTDAVSVFGGSHFVQL
jgi:hypothetical protein